MEADQRGYDRTETGPIDTVEKKLQKRRIQPCVLVSHDHGCDRLHVQQVLVMKRADREEEVWSRFFMNRHIIYEKLSDMARKLYQVRRKKTGELFFKDTGTGKKLCKIPVWKIRSLEAVEPLYTIHKGETFGLVGESGSGEDGSCKNADGDRFLRAARQFSCEGKDQDDLSRRHQHR